jgi:hypothetical protein
MAAAAWTRGGLGRAGVVVVARRALATEAATATGAAAAASSNLGSYRSVRRGVRALGGGRFSHVVSRGLRVRVQGTKYGGKYTVTLIPGDGIGRELTDAVRAVFKVWPTRGVGARGASRSHDAPTHTRVHAPQAAATPVEWELINLTADETGHVNVDDALASLRRNKVGLKGASRGHTRCPTHHTTHMHTDTHTQAEAEYHTHIHTYTQRQRPCPWPAQGAPNGHATPCAIRTAYVLGHTHPTLAWAGLCDRWVLT